MDKETFETLWGYCTSDNRVCPKIKKWYDVWALLKNTESLSGHGGTREPADPVIIDHHWYSDMPLEIHLQFKKYIEWASDSNQIVEIGKYLRSLSEDEWVHWGEP